jgi:hypothetical protein
VRGEFPQFVCASRATALGKNARNAGIFFLKTNCIEISNDLLHMLNRQ